MDFDDVVSVLESVDSLERSSFQVKGLEGFNGTCCGWSVKEGLVGVSVDDVFLEGVSRLCLEVDDGGVCCLVVVRFIGGVDFHVFELEDFDVLSVE